MIEWTEMMTDEMSGHLNVGLHEDLYQKQMKWYDSMFNIDKMENTYIWKQKKDNLKNIQARAL